MNIRKVGVVGFGIMGRGIAEVCARAGYRVTAVEVNQELIDKGMKATAISLKRSARTGKISPEDETTILNNLTTTLKIEELADCDLVIEAANEDIELKKRLFAKLDALCPAATILATNTSCLSIIDIASATKRQDKVMGLHFFNPVPQMQLLEAVRSITTSEETLNTGIEFGKTLGKTVITAPDTPGFIVNRLLMPILGSAIQILESGIATVEDIDKAISLGLNHPMGPFKLADLVGIDTVYHIAEYMYKDLKSAEMAPPPLLQKMVAAGHLGRKTGQGFYNYQ